MWSRWPDICCRWVGWGVRRRARGASAFNRGWDGLREQRLRRLLDAGLMSPGTTLSARDPTQPAWADEPEQAWQLRCMQAYAAQVDRMDQGIATIVEALRDVDALRDTLLVFLSDNGASCEELPKVDLERFRRRSDILRVTTRDGRPVRIGNSPAVVPGAEDTYASYGRAWANLSNTPFRYYKRWVHEGGIATPLIVHWPDGGLADRSIVHHPFQLVDVVPTVLETTSAHCPDGGTPLEGRRMVPALRGEEAAVATQYWEHTGNCAVRRGRWKLVREHPHPWELYDLDSDRAETHDLADRHPDVVTELTQAFDTWAYRVGVVPWERTIELYVKRGATEEDAAG